MNVNLQYTFVRWIQHIQVWHYGVRLIFISDGQQYNFVYRYCSYFHDIVSKYRKLYDIDIVPKITKIHILNITYLELLLLVISY